MQTIPPSGALSIYSWWAGTRPQRTAQLVLNFQSPGSRLACQYTARLVLHLRIYKCSGPKWRLKSWEKTNQETMSKMQHSPATKRAMNEKLRRRRQSLLRKEQGLNQHCQAEVHILLYYNGKYHVYSLSRHSSWPPFPEQVVSRSSCAALRWHKTKALNRISAIPRRPLGAQAISSSRISLTRRK